MLFRRAPADHELFERLLKEKDRQITILAEQVDYLRVLLAERGATPLRSMALPPSPADPLAVQMGVPAYLSDEEEDVLALHESGLIDDAQLKQLRAQLGLPELQIA